jgi:PAS domain S-box-containing protein
MEPNGKERRLKQSEEKFKFILDNANDLITIINENLEHEYINEQAYFNLLGYSKKNIIGNTPLIPLHPDDQKKALKMLMEGFKSGEGHNEMRVRHKNGHYVWMDHKGKTFIDTDGKRKAVLISRDITERKKAEELIIKENKRLMDINQITSELITKTSHELKTPLNSMFAASELLLITLKDQVGDEALEFIEMIRRGGQRLKHLIENLLDLSRVESGKLEINRQNENIIKIMNNCISDIKYLADSRSINIRRNFPSEVYISIDRSKFEQIFVNLLTNSIKYTPPEGNIYINLTEDDDWLNISIKDTGIGLTKTEQKLLFQKFGKIERSIKNCDIEIGGLGLGLFISQELIELHGGKIIVKSQGSNKGATFTIKLPKVV